MWDLLIRDIANQVATFLTSRCTIRREEMMMDEVGSPMQVYKDVATNVPCRLIRADKSVLKEFGLQETNREAYRLIVKADLLLVKGHTVIANEVDYQIL